MGFELDKEIWFILLTLFHSSFFLLDRHHLKVFDFVQNPVFYAHDGKEK